jgi:hypothetical protein
MPVLHHLHNHQLDDLQVAFLNEEIAHLLKEKVIWPLLNNKNALISPRRMASSS